MADEITYRGESVWRHYLRGWAMGRTGHPADPKSLGVGWDETHELAAMVLGVQDGIEHREIAGPIELIARVEKFTTRPLPAPKPEAATRR